MGLLTDLAQGFENALQRFTELPGRVDRVEEMIQMVQAENQAHLDELRDSLADTATALENEMQALKDRVDAGETLDFSGVDDIAAHLRSVADAAADPAQPVPTPEPGSGADPTTPPAGSSGPGEDPVSTDPSAGDGTAPADPFPGSAEGGFGADDGSTQQI